MWRLTRSLQRTAGGAVCLHSLLIGPPPLSFCVRWRRQLCGNLTCYELRAFRARLSTAERLQRPDRCNPASSSLEHIPQATPAAFKADTVVANCPLLLVVYDRRKLFRQTGRTSNTWVVVRCLCWSVHFFALSLSQLDADEPSSGLVLEPSRPGEKHSCVLLLAALPGMAPRRCVSETSMRVASPNETRQPTPVERAPCIRRSPDRRGCAGRSASPAMNDPVVALVQGAS